MKHDLNDMMVFLAVIETGSFTLAADRLNMPKANVSRKVSRLEKELQVTLLERSTRSQRLTEAGKKYLVHCKRVHEELDLAASSVTELLHSYKGDLKIGASISTGQQILKPALASFMQQFPDINVQLQLLNRRVDFIEEGFDVVIRIGQLSDSNLIAKKLGQVTRKIYTSSIYKNKFGIPEHIKQLTNHQLLICNPINNSYKLTLSSNESEEFILNKKPKLLVDDFEMLKQSLIDGLGITIMPDYMLKDELSTGKVINILPDWGLSCVDIYALYPRNRAKIPKVKAFISFVESLYKDVLNK